MNDESDHFARWVQGLCAIPLGLLAAFEIYTLIYDPFSLIHSSFGLGATYLTYRCLRYALTGRANINRDDY